MGIVPSCCLRIARSSPIAARSMRASCTRCSSIVKRSFSHLRIAGANPEVFEYRLRHDEAEQCFAFAARFYESFEVYGFSSPGMVIEDKRKAGIEPASSSRAARWD